MNTPTTDLFKKIRELEDKAHKFDNMKDRYTKIAEKIQEGIRKFNEALEMMNPTLKLDNNQRARSPKGSYQDIFDWDWNVIRTGGEVSSMSLMKAYPDLTDNQMKAIFTKICHFKGIVQRKEGRRIFVYMDKV